jgi:hypothetical protein
MLSIREESKPGTTPEPEWFSKTEEEKQEHTYWTCSGESTLTKPAKKYFWQKNKTIQIKESDLYSIVFHSKEEAEAYSSPPNPYWIWDKEPAKPTTLQEVMNRARIAGRKGVMVKGWQNGRWQDLQRWEANRPLNLENK